MLAHLDSNIKDLMASHPGLGALLESEGIGCANCGLGTCRTRDILEIHNLDTARIRTLLEGMGRIIHGGAPFEVPDIQRKAVPENDGFCPPLQAMVREHAHILRVIACLPALGRILDRDPDGYDWAEEVLTFVRNYADRFHHAKEEDVLFRFFDGDSDIIQAMLADHGEGRGHVAAAADGIARRDAEQVRRSLAAYGELLRGHIHREDTVLYPWMDRTLSMRQVGELFAGCAAAERPFGKLPQELEAFVGRLEARLA